MYKDLEGLVGSMCKDTIFNTTEIDGCGRQEHFEEQRKTYGFDAREIWSMGFTTITWLYAHLKRFKEWCPFDLYGEDAHVYMVNIVLKDGDNYLYDKVETRYNDDENYYSEIVFKKEKKELTVGEIIDIIIEYFEYYLKSENDIPVEAQLAEEGMKLYAEILQSLWT